MQKKFIYQNRPKRKADVGIYHENYNFGVQDRQAFSQMNQVLENIDHRQYVQRLASQMTLKEKEVVYMRGQGTPIGRSQKPAISRSGEYRQGLKG